MKTGRYTKTDCTRVSAYISTVPVPWNHLLNPTSEICKESKKSVFPNWLMPKSNTWRKILLFSINILSTASFLPYSHSHEVHHILPRIETCKSQKPPGLHIPLIYSWFISVAILSIDTCFRARVPSGTLTSLLTSRVQSHRRQSEQRPPCREQRVGSPRLRFPGANPVGRVVGWQAAPLPSTQQALEATACFPTYSPHF